MSIDFEKISKKIFIMAKKQRKTAILDKKLKETLKKQCYNEVKYKGRLSE